VATATWNDSTARDGDAGGTEGNGEFEGEGEGDSDREEGVIGAQANTLTSADAVTGDVGAGSDSG